MSGVEATDPMNTPVPISPDRNSRDLATVGDLRRAAAAEKTAAAAVARAKRTKNYIWATSGIVVSTVVITTSTLVFAQNAIDGGAARAVAPAEKRITAVEGDVAVIKSDLATVQRSTIRTEAMIEMVLRDRGIQPPPRQAPFPADGGP